MKNRTFLVGLLSISLAVHSCKEKETIIPEPSSYAVSNSSGVLLAGDSSLVRMSHLGLENIPDFLWLNTLGFIPKREPKSTITLVPYANPYTTSTGLRAKIISNNSPIAHLYTDPAGATMDYYRGGLLNSFPIATSVNIEIIPRGIDLPSKYTSFIVVTSDSCAYFINHFLKRN